MKVGFSGVYSSRTCFLDEKCLHRLKTRIVRESDYSPASQLFLQGEKKPMTGNYHRLSQARSHDDVHTKFRQILSIRSEDIERKQNSEVNQGLLTPSKFCEK